MARTVQERTANNNLNGKSGIKKKQLGISVCKKKSNIQIGLQEMGGVFVD
jgi:hypothetical protein